MPKVNLMPYSGAPKDAEKVAAKIAYYMQLRGYSPNEMAAATGMSDRSFREKLRYRPHNFRLQELVLAAKKFGIKLEELVG